MPCYIYNTDGKTLGDDVRFERLIQRGAAVTGGDPSFGETLKRLAEGDTLLMFQNRIGVVARGTVLEPWDRVPHETLWYYDSSNHEEWPAGSREYRIGVNWSRLSEPIRINALRQCLGYKKKWAPRRPIVEVDLPAQLRELIDARCPATDSETIIAEASRPFGGGESECHRALKQYIAKNPGAIGLRFVGPGLTEFGLPSGDCLDVSFEDEVLWVAVEVKSAVSDCTDIARGLFQCVKYTAVMEAVLLIQGRKQKAGALLVLEGNLPEPLVRLRDQLGIRVVDGVAPGAR
ncbi:MAG TPA: hypothetical protein VHY91_08575 [Pirellulales bacterium]|jgi:hypothetical protein|nr:hypothetical protein [Pirellulales bacterium]